MYGCNGDVFFVRFSYHDDLFVQVITCMYVCTMYYVPTLYLVQVSDK